MADIVYKIVLADRIDTPFATPERYHDPAIAAKDARRLAKELGEKCVVKAVVNDRWKERERARQLNGTYRPLTWDHMGWWNQPTSIAIHRDHFAHPSVEKPGWLAYTKSPEDGARDKQTVVRPGSYLNQHFKQILEYHNISVDGLVKNFMRAFGPIDIKFATTEEEIIKVYNYGPETCMVGRKWHGDGRNPAHIYAYGDLQVAYIGDLNSKVTARTLVWPEKKLHSRVYGDIARMTQGLERLGYKWGAPIGAKIKRVPFRELKFDPRQPVPSCCFIAPYIDKKNMRGGGHLGVIDRGDHLEICAEGEPGSHHCGSAEGMSGAYVPRQNEYPTFTCERCGTQGHRELLTVQLESEPGQDTEDWCRRCAQNNSWTCAYSGERFDRGAIIPVVVEDDNWSPYYVDMYADRCEIDGQLYQNGHLIKVEYPDGTSKKVNCHYYYDNKGFQSRLTQKHYLGGQKVVVWVGRVYYPAAKDELKYHAFECSQCKKNHLLEYRVQVDGGDKLICETCDIQNKNVAAAKNALKAPQRLAQHLDEQTRANLNTLHLYNQLNR